MFELKLEYKEAFGKQFVECMCVTTAHRLEAKFPKFEKTNLLSARCYKV